MSGGESVAVIEEVDSEELKRLEAERMAQQLLEVCFFILAMIVVFIDELCLLIYNLFLVYVGRRKSESEEARRPQPPRRRALRNPKHKTQKSIAGVIVGERGISCWRRVQSSWRFDVKGCDCDGP